MGDWMISHIMQGKLLRQTLDKFMKSPVAQEARVQVVLPNGVLRHQRYTVVGKQIVRCKRNT